MRIVLGSTSSAWMPNLLEFALPLFGERRAAEYGKAVCVALLQQLGGDQACLDGLADADVVGDQQADVSCRSAISSGTSW